MNEDEKVNIHAVLAMITSGQLLFLGLLVWQHAQAYLPRMWRSTKNCAGTQPCCSLTSSPMRLKAWPQVQCVGSIS